MKNNGSLLNTIRIIKGFSLDQLAISSGLSKGLLSRYESGNRPLSDERLKELCDIMNIPTKLIELITTQHIGPKNKELAQELGILLLKELSDAKATSK